MDRTYPRVRALERGIALLTELNMRGRARPSELAAACGIDRTTTYRILSTLADLGLVAKSQSDECWTLAAGVRRLSEGFTESDELIITVAQEIARMLPEVRWPSDYGTFHRGRVVIRETTHHFSPFSVHRAMVGRYRPLVRSAMGRAILAAASAEERRAMLEIAVHEEVPDAAEAADLRGVERIVADVRARGYAWSVGGSEASISAIALPVRSGERVMGALNIVFFRSAMSVEEAAERHLSHLQACVAAIEARCGALPPPVPAAEG